MRRWILWDFKRTDWQYDVLCLLIVAFIFLSPKDWFPTNKRTTESPAAAVQDVDLHSSSRP